MEKGFFHNVFKGYAGLLKGLGFFAVLVGASAGLGFLAAWPLWIFATHSPAAYTVFCFVILAGGLVSIIVHAALKRRSGKRGLWASILTIGAWIALFALGLYGIIYLVSRGSVLAVVPLVILLVLALGWLASMASSRRRSPPS
jgi:hypothetical protein